jgi:hypothetical protein
MTHTSATEQALTQLEAALADLRAHRAEYHPRTFDLIAEPIIEEIARFRALLETEASGKSSECAQPQEGVRADAGSADDETQAVQPRPEENAP